MKNSAFLHRHFKTKFSFKMFPNFVRFYSSFGFFVCCFVPLREEIVKKVWSHTLKKGKQTSSKLEGNKVMNELAWLKSTFFDFFTSSTRNLFPFQVYDNCCNSLQQWPKWLFQSTRLKRCIVLSVCVCVCLCVDVWRPLWADWLWGVMSCV